MGLKKPPGEWPGANCRERAAEGGNGLLVACREGVEPSTNGVEAHCSVRLSYRQAEAGIVAPTSESSALGASEVDFSALEFQDCSPYFHHWIPRFASYRS